MLSRQMVLSALNILESIKDEKVEQLAMTIKVMGPNPGKVTPKGERDRR